MATLADGLESVYRRASRGGIHAALVTEIDSRQYAGAVPAFSWETDGLTEALELEIGPRARFALWNENEGR